MNPSFQVRRFWCVQADRMGSACLSLPHQKGEWRRPSSQYPEYVLIYGMGALSLVVLQCPGLNIKMVLLTCSGHRKPNWESER